MLPDAKRFNLGYLGADIAQEDPGRIAIVDWQDGARRSLSYGELDRRLDRVASLLSGLGLARGSRVAVLVGNRAEFVEVTYGAMRSVSRAAPATSRSGR
jgi:acyl-CoA synthetase (AMP-forming)/AMP-acid ligase II